MSQEHLIAKDSSHSERIAEFLEGDTYRNAPRASERDFGGDWTWYKGGDSKPIHLPANEGNAAHGLVNALKVALPLWIILGIVLGYWLDHC